MKKTSNMAVWSVILVLVTLLAVPSAWAAEVDDSFLLKSALYGAATWADVRDGFDTLTEAERADFLGDYDGPIDRLLHVQTRDPARREGDGIVGLWMLVPEDGPAAEAYFGKCIRFRLDEGSFPDNGVIVTPALFEIAGEVAEGFIQAIGTDYMILNPYGGGETLRIALTPDTQWTGNLHAGGTCEVLYDPDAMTAFVFSEANG